VDEDEEGSEGGAEEVEAAEAKRRSREDGMRTEERVLAGIGSMHDGCGNRRGRCVWD
jgi:hypothetical protein